jgi:hypothetical protein
MLWGMGIRDPKKLHPGSGVKKSTGYWIPDLHHWVHVSFKIDTLSPSATFCIKH